MMCVVCVSMYLYMLVCVCMYLCPYFVVYLGVSETCRLIFKVYLFVCVSFIRTTMKVQLDTEIAIQIRKNKNGLTD